MIRFRSASSDERQSFSPLACCPFPLAGLSAAWRGEPRRRTDGSDPDGPPRATRTWRWPRRGDHGGTDADRAVGRARPGHRLHRAADDRLRPGGANHLSWVLTAYLLAVTAVTPLWGELGDQFGRKHLFLTCIVIFLLGSVLCGRAREMLRLILFRAVQGVGGVASWCAGLGDHRGRRPTPRARQVPRNVRSGLRRFQCGRSDPGWPVRGPPVLALVCHGSPTAHRSRYARPRRNRSSVAPGRSERRG